MPLNLRHAQEELRTMLNEASLPRVTFVSKVEDALRTADLAIDCVPDELESKLEIFCLMDRMAPPRTVFATPSETSRKTPAPSPHWMIALQSAPMPGVVRATASFPRSSRVQMAW